MKKLSTRTVLFLFLLSGSLAYSQQAPRTISEVYYHKLKPGHTMQEALAMESEWKKLHQLMVDDGFIQAWYVLEKGMTTNPDQREYDYVTIKTFGDMAVMDDSYPQKYRKAAFGDKVAEKVADLLRRTDEVQEHVKVELWETRDAIADQSVTSIKDIPVWQFEYMKVKDNKYDQYLEVEKIFKTIHQERMKRQNIKGWTLAGLSYPWATEKGYDYATVTFFPSMKAMDNTSFMQDYKKAQPNGDYQKLYNQTMESRDLVRSEIYYLRDWVVPSPKLVKGD